ncbi:hypothetical protein ABZX77_38305 [Streptomyces sp. NPDC004237]|uniref:hypothetical protein n=1 Tax=Streptomyces sp. NPDC004237 TaxID=3154455 RepID=UPI0033AD0F57
MGKVSAWAARVRVSFAERTPIWASREELGPWEQREILRSRIAELEAVLDAVAARSEADSETSGVAACYAEKARKELRSATDTLGHRSHPMMRRASHLGVAQSHVDSALNLMVWMASLDDITALLPDLVARIDEHFAPGDPRRVRSAAIARKLADPRNAVLKPGDRDFLAETISLARRLKRRETLRVRSFVRIVSVVTVCLTVAAVGIAIAGFRWKHMVPLCFTPQMDDVYYIVCPTRTQNAGPTQPTTEDMAKTARAADYLVVELVGVVSAAIASAAALRRIRGTALPYDVPVVLALLKLPTGAITAVLGLLLMRGGFVPGLSALDSTAQLIAWAVVFGYSQQLFTRSVDSQGQALLDAVRGPQSPVTPGDKGPGEPPGP